MVPLDMLGIATPEDSNDLMHTANSQMNDKHRAIISYAQYKDMGTLYDSAFDETITRRWGVDVKIATPILSLTILVPSSNEPTKSSNNGHTITGISSNPSSKIILSRDSEIANVEREREISKVQRASNISTPREMNSSDQSINISIHDDDDHSSLKNSAEITLKNVPDIFDEVSPTKKTYESGVNLENEAIYLEKRVVKRGLSDDEDDEQQLVYRSLGSPHLSQPIKLQMWLNIERSLFGPRANPQCVRWNSFTSSWTRLGCQTQTPNFEAEFMIMDGPIIINCSCTHISNYAVLIDVIDPSDIPEPSLLIQITTLSAFTISLPILFVVLVALALLRGLQTNSNTIHQNLVLCVFFAEMLFFIGFQSRRNLIDTEFSCKIIAICLHYAWLAAFAWTTVDCVHLYRMLTEMRDVNHGPMGFYFSIGYGAPAIVVGLSVGVRAHEYGNNLL